MAEFTFDEFTVEIKKNASGQSLGSGWIEPGFFQHFWKMFGQEVFKYCIGWLRDLSFPMDLNDTNIVLIPKKVGLIV